MRNIQKFVRAVIPILALSACDGLGVSGSAGSNHDTSQSEVAGAPSCSAGVAQTGPSRQGRSFQGRSFQGRSFQGTGPAVSTVQSIQLNGVAVQNLALQGTLVTGTVNGQPVAGTDFIGATVIQQDVDGSTFTSTLTNVTCDPQDTSGEVYLYTLTALNPNTGVVENICNPDPWGGQWATPVYGTWDTTGTHTPSTTQFMFGCTSGVVAKCVRWGYRPWKSVNGVSLGDYHQACTRMARADYCGDGVSHTMDGTLIDMYDNLHIQQKAPFDATSPLVFDAAWSPQGAYCITKDRWLALQSLTTFTLSCKLKFLDLTPLVATSPVDPTDLCLVKRPDVAQSAVLMDNRSGVNISLN